MAATDIEADIAFVEQTLFMIFLWAGIWGLMEHGLTTLSKNVRLIVYCVLILFSCCALYLRGHTKKLVSL